MRRVSFDYANTCPKIDAAIASARQEIYERLRGLIEEICPVLPQELINKLADEHSELVYDDLEGIFEGVRATNEEMRREAELQIQDLKEEIYSLEYEIKEKQ